MRYGVTWTIAYASWTRLKYIFIPTMGGRLPVWKAISDTSHPNRLNPTPRWRSRGVTLPRFVTPTASCGLTSMRFAVAPRSQNDYLELAKCFHTIIVSDIPVLFAETDDHARRFINLVDILYDRNVKFMGSGSRPPHQLYQGRSPAPRVQSYRESAGRNAVNRLFGQAASALISRPRSLRIYQ